MCDTNVMYFLSDANFVELLLNYYTVTVTVILFTSYSSKALLCKYCLLSEIISNKQNNHLEVKH